MICPVCNQNIPDGSNYCPSCAADLAKYRRQIIAAGQARRSAEQHPSPQQPYGGAPAQDPRYVGQQPQGYPPYQGGYPQQQAQQQPVYPPAQPGYHTGQAGHQGGYHDEYADQQGEGGFFEGISPRGKLFYGIGALVLLIVLVVLIVNMLNGSGNNNNNKNNNTVDLPVITQQPTPPASLPNPLDPTPDPTPESPLNNIDLTVQTTPAPTPLPPFSILKKGSTGPEVIRLQERLKLFGYLTGVVDGDYGSDTVSAVRKFQTEMGLNADGAAGPETQTKLFSVPIDNQPAGAETTVQTPQPQTQPAGSNNQPG